MKETNADGKRRRKDQTKKMCVTGEMVRRQSVPFHRLGPGLLRRITDGRHSVEAAKCCWLDKDQETE